MTDNGAQGMVGEEAAFPERVNGLLVIQPFPRPWCSTSHGW